ncbi:MAG TPA: hypothetical protein VEX13_17645, partial [Chloroflexia bacterium]|nr:hypothetical protein [Chloroflexia bacterium]
MQQPKPEIKGGIPATQVNLQTQAQSQGAMQPVVSMPAPSDMRTRPRGAAPASDTPRPLSVRTIAHGGITWVDIVHPGDAEIEWLRAHYQFHPLYLD